MSIPAKYSQNTSNIRYGIVKTFVNIRWKWMVLLATISRQKVKQTLPQNYHFLLSIAIQCKLTLSFDTHQFRKTKQVQTPTIKLPHNESLISPQNLDRNIVTKDQTLVRSSGSRSSHSASGSQVEMEGKCSQSSGEISSLLLFFWKFSATVSRTCRLWCVVSSLMVILFLL